jgi:hypothetical protein
MKRALLLLSLSASPLSAENLIRMLIDTFKQPGHDISQSNQGIKRVKVGSFYYYKSRPVVKSEPLTPDQIDEQARKKFYETFDPVAAKAALDEINQRNADNKPIQSTIDTTPQSTELAAIAEANDKRVVYGDESPLQDQQVIAAWERATEAKKALDEHRVYMERIRASKKTIEQSKQTTSTVTQNSE